MIPSGRLLYVVLALAGLAIPAAVSAPIANAWPWAIAVLIAIATVDAGLALRWPGVDATRTVPRSLSLQRAAQVSLEIRAPAALAGRRLSVFDGVPATFATEGLPAQCVPGEDGAVTVAYPVTPLRRGDHDFSRTAIRVASPLGLWWRQRDVGNRASVQVYPDFSRVSRDWAGGVDRNAALAGLHLQRKRGEGTEFHELRDYRDGDALRALDWKATARLGRMIARDYRHEQNQQLTIVLDTGRRMRAEDDDLSHFDHALNAILMLSYTALRQGDSVSLMTMGGESAWMPPVKGAGGISEVLRRLYRLETVPEEVDYLAAASALSVRQRRRALVVMITNIRDDDAEDLAGAVRLLRQRHVVVLASLRELALDQAAMQEVTNLDTALKSAGASYYLAGRTRARQRLEAMGVAVDDCRFDELASAVTHRYLTIKRAGEL